MNKNEIIKIIEAINEISQLSITEEKLLDSILTVFSAKEELGSKTEKIRQLEQLLNDETDSLLQSLNQREVINYVTYSHGFIAEDDKSSLVSALENLNYNFIDAVDVDDMVLKIERCGYTITEYNEHKKYDIVTQSDLDELTSNFLSGDFKKRKLMLQL